MALLLGLPACESGPNRSDPVTAVDNSSPESPLPRLSPARQREIDDRLLNYLASGDVDRAGVSALLDSGADPNATDPRNARNPAIVVAAMNIKAVDQIGPVIDLLVERGANIDAQNANGVTAAMGSIWNDHPVETMRTVLKHAPNPNLATSQGRNLLAWAIVANPCSQLVPLVLETDVDVNAKTTGGQTPLAMSISLCTRQCDAILARGGTADPADVLDNGRTLMEHAELVASTDSWFATSRTLEYLRARARGDGRTR